MIKVENVDVWGFEHAIRGMRNPKNSWAKSDSKRCNDRTNCDICPKDTEDGCTLTELYTDADFIVGPNDLDLMRRLYKAGPEHRKYLRQIFVSMDVTCHHIFWSELDTYKIGTTRNSCSKMHKIHVKPFERDDFSHEGIDEVGCDTLYHFSKTLEELEKLRVAFNNTHEKKYWRAMLELLPMGYNIRATYTMNYENVVSIIHQRSGHKVQEWNEFVDILKGLPYIKEIMEE